MRTKKSCTVEASKKETRERRKVKYIGQTEQEIKP